MEWTALPALFDFHWFWEQPTLSGNDNFANRILLSGSNVTTTNQNLGATLEPGEPLHHGYYGGKSVWWRWTSPGTGFVTIDTIGSLFDTIWRCTQAPR